ncbi:hypothetical protein [Acinetobacter schindleri]|jgi:hypothetical protein|uniref:hypothetical protein n=1 Tax=Acinetobacter schindleri TaxID=108981 RepID=UPI002DB6AD98|nr:hypothetical protein [Acinetobacter schindleri]MEB5929653.1 hypothetical protein [Acinetobacter schindleri]
MNKSLVALVVTTLSYVSPTYSMTALDDEQLSQVEGQALFNLVKETDTTQQLDFYKLAINGQLSLNTNIKSLQLGCGGANGANGCDVDISELSFGCVTNAAGTCITLPATKVGQPTGADSNNTIENQAALKDFVLTNPFFQFAIKGGSQASTRQVVGVRVGAENAKGPMSIGTLNSFSGYLTGKTNLNILAQTNIAVTCDGRQTGCMSNNASKFSNDFTIDKLIGADDEYYRASGFLGVKDEEILSVLGVIKVRYKDLTIDTAAASATANVAANGKRMSQVGISNLGLGTIVDNVVNGLSVNQVCATPLIGSGCDAITSPSVANLLMPLLKTGIQVYMKEQTLTGLGVELPSRGTLETDSSYSTKLTNALNSYVLPYNLNNVHQLDVDSNLFGIALTSLDAGIKYPGYAEAVNKGWSMYLKDAFTLNINDSLTNLMSNLVQTGKAAQGNITLLEPAYRNCFGNLKFC